MISVGWRGRHDDANAAGWLRLDFRGVGCGSGCLDLDLDLDFYTAEGERERLRGIMRQLTCGIYVRVDLFFFFPRC